MTRGQSIEAHLGDLGSSQLQARAAGAQGCCSESIPALCHPVQVALGAGPLPSPRCTSVQPEPVGFWEEKTASDSLRLRGEL